MVDVRLRVLVTGGAGFIGSRVASAWVSRGAQTLVLDDLSTGVEESVPAGAELVVADIADPAVIDTVEALRPEVVVHAAAQVSVARSDEDPARDEAVNVRGTKHIVEGAQRAHSRRFVFVSSGGAVYGETSGADEDSPVAPKSAYGQNKRLAEVLVEESGLSYGIARLGNVYGPGQRGDLEGGVVAIFIERLAAGLPIEIHGTGDQRRDFVHVDDAATALLAISDTSRTGTWNVGTGVATSIQALLRQLEGLLGPAVELRLTPMRRGDVAESCLRIDRIRAELGWKPTVDLRTGLSTLVGSSPTRAG